MSVRLLQVQCKQQGGGGACVADVGMAQQFIKIDGFTGNYFELHGFVSQQRGGYQPGRRHGVGGVAAASGSSPGLTIPFCRESS